MTTHVLAMTNEPAAWSAAHERMLATVRAAGLHRSDPKPSAVKVLLLTEDIDDVPSGLVELVLPSIESA